MFQYFFKKCVFLGTFVSSVCNAGECEDNYPLVKNISEQVIEVPYTVLVQTPVQVASYVIEKVPVHIAKTCFTGSSKRECNIRKPWKCVERFFMAPFDCSETVYNTVTKEIWSTEFRNQTVNKTYRSIRKIETYARPFGYLACVERKVAENVGVAVHDAAKNIGTSVEDIGHFLEHSTQELRNKLIHLMNNVDYNEMKGRLENSLNRCHQDLITLDNFSKEVEGVNGLNYGEGLALFIASDALNVVIFEGASIMGIGAATAGETAGISLAVAATLHMMQSKYMGKLRDLSQELTNCQKQVTEKFALLTAKYESDSINAEIAKIMIRYKSDIENLNALEEELTLDEYVKSAQEIANRALFDLNQLSNTKKLNKDQIELGNQFKDNLLKVLNS